MIPVLAVEAVPVAVVATGYTSPEIIAVVSAIGGLATIIIGGVITIISTLRTNRVATEKVSDKVQTATVKLEEVHTLTNSNLSAMTQKFEMASKQIESLVESHTKEVSSLNAIILDLRGEREKLALVAAAIAQPTKKTESEK